MPAVTSSTIIGNSWKTVYDLLTDTTNGVTDPASRGLSARTAWVFPEFPDPNGSDFPNYPIITIKADPSTKISLIGKEGRDVTISFMITVFAEKAEHADSVADDIINIINTYQSTTEGYKLFNPDVTSGSTTAEERSPGEHKIHMKAIFVDYILRSI